MTARLVQKPVKGKASCLPIQEELNDNPYLRKANRAEVQLIAPARSKIRGNSQKLNSLFCNRVVYIVYNRSFSTTFETHSMFIIVILW